MTSITDSFKLSISEEFHEGDLGKNPVLSSLKGKSDCTKFRRLTEVSESNEFLERKEFTSPLKLKPRITTSDLKKTSLFALNRTVPARDLTSKFLRGLNPAPRTTSPCQGASYLTWGQIP